MAYFKSKTKIEYKYPPIPVEPSVFPTIEPTPPSVDPSETPTDSATGLINDTNLVFYIVEDDPNTAYKNKTNQYVMTGTIQQDIDLLNPVIIIDTNVDLTKYNYIYISCLERYYFCKVSLLYGGRYEVTCNVDALSTFIQELIYIPCIIDKEEIHNDLYINDGTYVQGNKNYTTVTNFSGGFNDTAENILICCGGV